jgi:hypothetical protein
MFCDCTDNEELTPAPPDKSNPLYKMINETDFEKIGRESGRFITKESSRNWDTHNLPKEITFELSSKYPRCTDCNGLHGFGVRCVML